ncbi:hypothetical protein MYX76_14390 [Desulfobacterota bacterium AH_259_B03_O07]|nr:hypothetical protein [Desulfobacterota bacterium AH_259_B03_O07]
MSEIEEILSHQLNRQLHLIQNKNLYPHMDWIAFKRIVAEQLVPSISDAFTGILEEARSVKNASTSALPISSG